MKLVVFCIILLFKYARGNRNFFWYDSMEDEFVLYLVDPSGNCPPGYMQPKNSNWTNCYRIYYDAKSKTDAARQCVLDNGTLASIPNVEVNSYLHQYANQIGATSVWIGIECLHGDLTTCENDDITESSYSNWYNDEPSLRGQCVYMSTKGPSNEKWSTFDCNQKFEFVCETSALNSEGSSPTTDLPTTSSSKSCPPNYKESNGTCYTKMFNKFGLPRDKQSEECQKTPCGRMATIPNQEVNELLTSLDCDNPQFGIGLLCPNVTFNGDTSSCKWDDGTPFEYNAFFSGLPTVTSAECVWVSNGQWFNGVKCQQGFMCWACQASMQ